MTRVNNGTPLTPTDLNVLGRFDAVSSAALDAGFERGDQIYRTVARALSWAVAILLAEAAAPLVSSPSWHNAAVAFLVGLIATPLAPVAKDLSSALNAAASAYKAAKG